ncbi:hypothetical protein FPE01S_04_00020 [Flavihumibacter petaseus NBRC 106054]|uniref:Uncharacterized protein n=2 Tax=Flavihumibacter TaxID=1004301 RepID=A0A0E9N4K0_9BACT|nr:hypothetical protein FPE01S_04_00020 [Flavihumibacter petaseus NBRC 106054]
MLLMVFSCWQLPAQEGGFIYIESSPTRPFYLRNADSMVLSSPAGYIILAPLASWRGDIIVGFQGQPQAAFVFTLEDTLQETGWLLRDMGQEGWRLLDWRKNESVAVRRLGREEVRLSDLHKRTDAFAVRLSQVVNDSIILYDLPQLKAVAAGQKGGGDPVVKGPGKGKASGTAPQEKVQVTVKPAVAPVKRLFKTDMGGSWKMIYAVTEPGGVDTVEVNIIKLKPPVKGKPKRR